MQRAAPCVPAGRRGYSPPVRVCTAAKTAAGRARQPPAPCRGSPSSVAAADAAGGHEASAARRPGCLPSGQARRRGGHPAGAGRPAGRGGGLTTAPGHSQGPARGVPSTCGAGRCCFGPLDAGGSCFQVQKSSCAGARGAQPAGACRRPAEPPLRSSGRVSPRRRSARWLLPHQPPRRCSALCSAGMLTSVLWSCEAQAGRCSRPIRPRRFDGERLARCPWLRGAHSRVASSAR